MNRKRCITCALLRMSAKCCIYQADTLQFLPRNAERICDLKPRRGLVEGEEVNKSAGVKTTKYMNQLRAIEAHDLLTRAASWRGMMLHRGAVLSTEQSHTRLTLAVDHPND